MKLLIGLLLSALLLTGSWVRSAWAEEHSGCKCMMNGEHINMIIKHAKDLDLTKDQVTKLRKIHHDLEINRVRKEAEIRVAEMEVGPMVEDEKTSVTAIEDKLKQKAAIETGLDVDGVKALRAALALLTPEQREKAQAEHEKMMDEMHGHMAGMGGMGGMSGMGGMGGGMSGMGGGMKGMGGGMKGTTGGGQTDK